MTRKKYELLKDDKIELYGKTLYRIKALIDFDIVVAGSLGGYIEKEDNLAHTGNAWVSGNARVSDNARVSGNAWVSGDARVHGNAWVSGDARVYGDAEVYGDDDLVWFSNVGTEQGTLTVYKSKDGSLLAARGCFSGTVDEFLAKSAEVHNERIQREYRLLIEVAKSRLLGESYVPTL